MQKEETKDQKCVLQEGVYILQNNMIVRGTGGIANPEKNVNEGAGEKI